MILPSDAVVCPRTVDDGVGEEIDAFDGLEEVEQFADARPQGVDRAFLGLAEMRLEL